MQFRKAIPGSKDTFEVLSKSFFCFYLLSSFLVARSGHVSFVTGSEHLPERSKRVESTKP